MYSTRNLTVKVNTEERLEVLICYLPHSKRLPGGLRHETQEEADGVLGWDGKEVDVTGMRQAKEASVAYSSKSQQAASYREAHPSCFLGRVAWKSFTPGR